MERSTIRLRRNGREVEMVLEQVSPTTLARVFTLDPSTLWLKEEFGHRAFFPTGDKFDDLVDVLSVTVEGSPPSATSHQSPSSPTCNGPLVLSTSSTPSSSSSTRPIFSKKGSSSATVKITKAIMKRNSSGKAEFNVVHQTFINVNDSNANVHYIENAVQQKWGRNYILVTSDGLPIEDSSGTQGLSFWKVGSRRIYAITKPKCTYVVSSDNDSDFELITPKMKKTCNSVSNTHTLNKLCEDVSEIRSDLQDIFKITKGTKVPIGLTKILQETFVCHICRQAPMRPPIIFARCCKRIVGCQACVDQWFLGQGHGEPKNSCPVCRSERAYADTTQLKGMDEFLKSIVPLINEDTINFSDSD